MKLMIGIHISYNFNDSYSILRDAFGAIGIVLRTGHATPRILFLAFLIKKRLDSREAACCLPSEAMS